MRLAIALICAFASGSFSYIGTEYFIARVPALISPQSVHGAENSRGGPPVTAGDDGAIRGGETSAVVSIADVAAALENEKLAGASAPRLFKLYLDSVRHIGQISEFPTAVNAARQWTLSTVDPPAIRLWLLKAAFVELIKERPSRSQVLVALQALDVEEQLELIFAFAAIEPFASLADLQAKAIRLATEVPVDLSPEMRDRISDGALSIWVSQHPADALSLLQVSKNNSVGGALASTLPIIAKYDVKAALELLSKVVHSDARFAAELAYRSGLPASRVEEALRNAPAAERSTFITTYVQTVLFEDPLAVDGIAAAFPATNLDPQVRNVVAEGLLDFQPGVISGWLGSIPTREKVSVLNEASFSPGIRMPQSMRAENYLDQMFLLGAFDPQYCLRALGQLAQEHPEKAAALIERFPSDSKPQATKELFAGEAWKLSVDDPTQLQEFCQNAPDAIRAYVTQVSAGFWAHSDPKAALAWLATLPDDNVRRAAENAIIRDPLCQLPEEVLKRLCMEGLNREGERHVYIAGLEQLVSRRADDNPALAVAFLEEISDENVRVELTSHLAQYWSENDPVGAAEWISHLPIGPGRDSAITTLVGCSRDDPERALESAAAISDYPMRTQAVRAVVNHWDLIDRSYAQHLLERAPLLPRDKAGILSATQVRAR